MRHKNRETPQMAKQRMQHSAELKAAQASNKIKPKDIVTLNTWRAPKAKQGIVVRTYKAPDDDTALILPSSSTLYGSVIKAIESNDLESLDMYAVYRESKTFFRGEFKQ